MNSSVKKLFEDQAVTISQSDNVVKIQCDNPEDALLIFESLNQLSVKVIPSDLMTYDKKLRSDYCNSCHTHKHVEHSQSLRSGPGSFTPSYDIYVCNQCNHFWKVYV